VVDDVKRLGLFDRVIGALLVVSLLAINVAYTSIAINQSEAQSRRNNAASAQRHEEARAWTCASIQLFLDRFEVYPPENPAQEKLRDDHRALYDEICVPR